VYSSNITQYIKHDLKNYFLKYITCLISLLTILNGQKLLSSILYDPLNISYKPTKLINAQSQALLPTGNFEIILQNRSGTEEDGPQFRLDAKYGLSKYLTLGISNTNHLGTYDISAKTNILPLFSDSTQHSFTLIYYMNLGLHTEIDIKFDYLDQLSFFHQLIIDPKLNSRFSIQLLPTYIHKNIADTSEVNSEKDNEGKFTEIDPNFGYPWDMMFFGIGGSWNFSQSIKFIGEYFPLISDRNGSTENVSGWALGMDYHTSFAILQLQLSNTLHLSDKALVNDAGIKPTDKKHFGIKISRSFNLTTHYGD
jgi:hypothetical protein